MKKYVFLFISMFCVIVSSAQTVNYNVPDLANRQYWICAFQGADADTLARGIVPPNGVFTFTLPARYSDYCGILRFGIGTGQWNCIMNNENFSVTSRDNNIIFEQSTENEKILSLQKNFSVLTDKIDYIYRGMTLFADNSQFSNTLNSEFSNLNKSYSNLYAQLNSCNLYACKYMKIQHFTNGFAQQLFLPSEKKQNYAALLSYYSDSLSIDDLYTSDLYISAQSIVLKLLNSTAQLGTLMVKKLDQIHSDKIFNAFANDLSVQCLRNSWADAEDMIAQYLVNSNRLDKFSFTYQYASGVLKGKIGNVAPKIDGINSLKNTILFFYESDCPHCAEQIIEFKKHYNQLKDKGIQVISISSDREQSLFEDTAKAFEWEIKLCDFQGFEGKIFTDYGVRGTPVIFYIDKNEKIAGRYAHLDETKLIE